jgi:hypothetical protein
MAKRRPERPVLLRTDTPGDGRMHVLAITSYRILPDDMGIQPARTHDVTGEFLAVAAEMFPELVESGKLKKAGPEVTA